MKRFIALAALLVGSLVAFAFDAAAAGEAGALILSKNPQLSKIPDWPQPTGVGEPVDCNKDGRQQSLESMRKLSQTAYRCLVVRGTSGGQPWESGAGGSGLYQLQLHPNSPTVWRVFKRDEVKLIALIAEFDATGKLQFSQSARSPTNLLTAAQGNNTPQTAPAMERRERTKKLGECDRDPRYADLTDAEVKKRYEAVLASDNCKSAREDRFRGDAGSLTIEGSICGRGIRARRPEVIARGLMPKKDGSFCK